MDPQITQLLHGDRGGGAADPGGYHADRLSKQRSCIGHILPVGLHMDRIVKILSDGLTPARVSGENTILSNLARPALDMKPVSYTHLDVYKRQTFPKKP